MNLSELTQNTDQPMSTAMSIDGSNLQGNPTPPDSVIGVGTTVVGMGPVGTGIGTQCSVASDIPAANPPHIYPPSSITAPT
eukprot:4399995-Amphidinium_carterae.1